LADAAEAFRQHPELFDFTKPYFVGQRAVWRRLSPEKRAELERAAQPDKVGPAVAVEGDRLRSERALRHTVLYDVHREMGAKMTRFAGWEMPVEYRAGLLAEHRAVRTAAALFDVSHMSLFEVVGPDALAFLEGAVTNCVSRLDPGEAQYTCILDPEGRALDDLFLYRLQQDRFLIVSNAANAERVWDWLVALRDGTPLIDAELPAKRLPRRLTLRNLRESGEASLLNLAFQGPASLRVLAALCADAEERGRLGRLRPNHISGVTLVGIPVLAARTGYTGERVGFELYVHPGRAAELWHVILEKGKPEGVLPAGLGARDSTRTEAGLPLFGHELEGEWGLTPTEAGYGFVVRCHVPFFVGRRAYMERARASRRHLVRFRGKGRKTVRPGHTILEAPAEGQVPGAPGRPVGAVTSFCFVTPDFGFVVLAWVEEGFTPPPGSQVQAARVLYAGLSAPPESGGATGACQRTGAEKLAVAPEALVPLTVLSRFPAEQERLTWPQRYR
jgi:glycine hydroxymethyltransferase